MGVPAHPLRGYLLIACAALCWGASATLGKAVFNGALAGRTAINPLIIAQTRTTFSFLVFAPMLLFSRGARALRMGRHDLLQCILIGILGVAGSNFFYYYAIQKSTVATAITVQYTAPVWVLLYMAARGEQRATVYRLVAVAMALLGCALVVGAGSSRFSFSSVGVLAAFVAALSYSFYNVAGARMVGRHASWRVMLYALMGAAIFWTIVNPPWKIVAQHYSPMQWVFLAVFAIVSMLLPYNLYFAGLHYLDATKAVVTSCLEPVFAIVLAAAFVAESIHPLQGIGIALVLAATVLIQMPDRAAAPLP